MTALTPSAVSRLSGTDISAGMVAATNGDTMPAGPNNFLHVKNASGAAVTVTVTPPGGGPLGTSISAQPLAPTVGATTGDMCYGPFPSYPYGDANGNVTFTYSATASVTVKALTMAAS